MNYHVPDPSNHHCATKLIQKNIAGQRWAFSTGFSTLHFCPGRFLPESVKTVWRFTGHSLLPGNLRLLTKPF